LDIYVLSNFEDGNLKICNIIKDKLGVELTNQIPAPPKSSGRNRSILIVVLVIGLIIGLILGIFVSVVFNLSSSFHRSNYVQVSGTVSNPSALVLIFRNLNETIETSAQVINGRYSVSLLGGQSYQIWWNRIDMADAPNGDVALYVPSGVSTFTANF
jgi:hypothetical protein